MPRWIYVICKQQTCTFYYWYKEARVTQLVSASPMRTATCPGGTETGPVLRSEPRTLFRILFHYLYPFQGFGVCCLFFTSSCGSTINQNITYLQNPGYPSGYSTAASTQCEYIIQKVSPGWVWCYHLLNVSVCQTDRFTCGHSLLY